jgi:hypothetical protein
MKLLQKVGEDKKFIFTFLNILFLIALFFNSYFLKNIFFGIFFSILFFVSICLWLKSILKRLFDLDSLISLFLVFYLIAFILAVPIVFFKINSFYFYLSLLIFTIIISFLNHFLKKEKILDIEKKDLETKIKKNFLIFVWLIFYLLGWVLIIRSRTGEYIISPWQVISKYYQLVWLVISSLIIFFIFSKIKTKSFLLLIILTSLLFHSYLPFVSENSFGVDRWRHVGAERRLIEGNIEPPALIGKVDYTKFGPILIPKVFLMPNKFSYSNQWGMTIAFHYLTQIEILKIDQYLIWLLWSIFFIIFVYQISKIVFEKEDLSRLITFVSSFCFFSLQIAGAITIPHAIGFLLFLFFLIVFFSFLKKEDKKLSPLIFLSFILLIFNYILYLIVALEIFIFALALKNEKRKIILPILIVIFIFLLPILDRISQTSFFAYKINEIATIFPQKILEFFKNLPSYLYYKRGENLALPNLIKSIPWVIFFTFSVFAFAILGLINNFKKNLFLKIFTSFFFIFFFNQFISFSFMKDYRLLCQRLTNVLIFLLAIFFSLGVYYLIEKFKEKKFFIILFLTIFLSFFSLTTYVSGPNYGNVSKDELLVAKFLDQEIKKNKDVKICVFDAGWRLLALEAINGMIAGNFPTHPIDFIQKEKDLLYRQMLKNPSKEILEETKKITGAKKCFFVVNQSWLKPEIFEKTKEILGQPLIKNNTYIWQY